MDDFHLIVVIIVTSTRSSICCQNSDLQFLDPFLLNRFTLYYNYEEFLPNKGPSHNRYMAKIVFSTLYLLLGFIFALECFILY